MTMTLSQFLLVWLATLTTMLVCRVAPIFMLKNRHMPEALKRALNLIPPAAFAALVANDLFSPTMFDHGVVIGLIPFVAAGCVLVVARKTESLIACAITGVVAYAVLSLLVGAL